MSAARTEAGGEVESLRASIPPKGRDTSPSSYCFLLSSLFIVGRRSGGWPSTCGRRHEPSRDEKFCGAGLVDQQLSGEIVRRLIRGPADRRVSDPVNLVLECKQKAR